MSETLKNLSQMSICHGVELTKCSLDWLSSRNDVMVMDARVCELMCLIFACLRVIVGEWLGSDDVCACVCIMCVLPFQCVRICLYMCAWALVRISMWQIGRKSNRKWFTWNTERQLGCDWSLQTGKVAYAWVRRRCYTRRKVTVECSDKVILKSERQVVDMSYTFITHVNVIISESYQ